MKVRPVVGTKLHQDQLTQETLKFNSPESFLAKSPSLSGGSLQGHGSQVHNPVLSRLPYLEEVDAHQE